MSTNANVGSNAQVRGLVFSIFGIMSLLANAVLTAMFGYTFLAGAFGAVLLLLFFDVAAISWYVVRLDSGLSGAQRACAKMMSVATIVGSTLVSIVQVLTVSEVMPSGGWISTAAVWLVTLYGAANFFAIFFFQNASLSERNTEQREELAAQKADKIREMTQEAHDKAMDLASKLLMDQVPIISQRIALEAKRDYLQSMDSLDLMPSSFPTPTEGPKPLPEPAEDQGADAGAEQVEQAEEPDPIDDDASGYIDHPAPMPEPLDLEEFRNDTGMHSRPARGK